MNAISNTIKAIDKNTVNKICSGQVVLTLATAIKELLENSLDACATSVQIRLKEYGSESIEVIDNGYGVEESNFAGLTLKHHTSKMSEFEDLETVSTFGFRGEALSSLCSLGKMTIITRHKSALIGTRLRFDHNGCIVESTSVARQVGTTVMIENLFITLPVRHKEFSRNIKKDFGKLCQVLQAYALLNKNCSMNCANRVGGNNRTFLEKHTGSLRDNISSIFGPKQLTKLLEIKTVEPDNETLSEFRCQPGSSTKVTVEGFISSCEHGVGRSSQDRQFFYINSRPVDNLKFSKLVNEVYHQFNRHQYPFVVMNITLASETVDVNVVPDKRKIMLENEGLVLATIKTSIEQLLRPVPSFMIIDVGKPVQESLPRLSLTGLGQFRAKGAPVNLMNKTESVKKARFTQSLAKYISRTPAEKNEEPCPKRAKIEVEAVEIIAPQLQEINKVVEEIFEKSERSEMLEIVEDSGLTGEAQLQERKKVEEGIAKKSMRSEILAIIEECGLTENAQLQERIKFEDNIPGKSLEAKPEIQKAGEVDAGITEEEKENKRKITLSISIEDIIKKRLKEKPKPETQPELVKFFAKIDPSCNKRAEDELQKQLSQTGFLNMEILGQFNKGFIITRLDSDLFIIDQHATDEKSNFESISGKKLEMQRLTMPQALNLDAGKEELIQHRAQVLRYNGFDFRVDQSASATKRILLTAVPSIQGVTFDHRDVDELLFLLSDAPDGQMCRPSRVRDVIASKACRMSVMIGTALNHAQMKRLVHRMSELKQPWNCPHGRPTIRHLLSLGLLQTK